MPYASDKLEKGFLNRNRPRIAKEVKAMEIMQHLYCLTISDKEEVQATNRMDGNIHAMHKLLDNLVRRQNWPDQFIEALEVCDHTILAQEMRDAYDLLQPSYKKQEPTPPSPRPAPAMPADYQPPSPALVTPASAPAPVHSPPQAAECVPPPRFSPPPSNSIVFPIPTVAAPQPPIHPGTTTTQPALQPNTAPYPAASSSPAPAVMIPEASPSAAVHATTGPPVDGAQRPEMSSVAPGSGTTTSLGSMRNVHPAEVSYTSGSAEAGAGAGAGPGAGTWLGPRSPFFNQTPSESLLSARAPVQETVPPSVKEATLQLEPEETSEESMQQDSEVHLPPERQTTTTPPPIPVAATAAPAPAPAPATAPAPAVVPFAAAAPRRPSPPPLENDMEEEFFSKPGVLRSVVEVPAAQQQPSTMNHEESDICSTSSDDLEISRAAPNSTCAGPATTRTPSLSNKSPQAAAATPWSSVKAAGPCPEVGLQGASVSNPAEADVCSMSSDDLEVSRAASNANHGGPVATRMPSLANNGPQEAAAATSWSSVKAAGPCPEVGLQGAPVSSPAEVHHHQRESVNISHSSSLPYGVLDEGGFSSHRIPTEEHYEDADQSTMEHVIHVQQEPSIQNWAGQTPRVSRNDEAAVTQKTSAECHSPEPSRDLRHTDNFDSSKKTAVSTEGKGKSSHAEENRGTGGEEVERNEKNEQKEVTSAVLPRTPRNGPLIPAAVTVIGVIVVAVIFVWKTRR
ncbi:uncharacterized protein LOC134435214 [Engraulis encrasicolus]|uniref:uncharacterized protein LOC134435214 n=1 Tax=Engraulis encrasicolus TaxID=184585 RepID=UPI002FCF0A96